MGVQTIPVPLCAQQVAPFLPFRKNFFPLTQVVSSLALLLKTQRGPSTDLRRSLCAALSLSAIFPVNSSCLVLPRLPIPFSQLREPSGFACAPSCATAWKLSSGNKKGQISVSSFLFPSLRDHSSALTYSMSQNHCSIHLVRIFSCFRQEGKPNLLLHLGQNWKYVFMVYNCISHILFYFLGLDFHQLFFHLCPVIVLWNLCLQRFLCKNVILILKL